jgi:hypothetical protein
MASGSLQISILQQNSITKQPMGFVPYAWRMCVSTSETFRNKLCPELPPDIPLSLCHTTTPNTDLRLYHSIIHNSFPCCSAIVLNFIRQLSCPKNHQFRKLKLEYFAHFDLKIYIHDPP